MTFHCCITWLGLLNYLEKKTLAVGISRMSVGLWKYSGEQST